jgi:hypothetical protein
VAIDEESYTFAVSTGLTVTSTITAGEIEVNDLSCDSANGNLPDLIYNWAFTDSATDTEHFDEFPDARDEGDEITFTSLPAKSKSFYYELTLTIYYDGQEAVTTVSAST